MSAARDIDEFDGEDLDRNPYQFIRQLERRIGEDAAMKEDRKVSLMGEWITVDSAADEWYSDLAADEKLTWTTLLQAFEVRWPKEKAAKMSVTESAARVKSMTMDEAKLGEYEKLRGKDVPAHVVWAITVYAEAKRLKVPGIVASDVRAKLPEAFRNCMAAEVEDWDEFLAAVKKVSVATLKEKVSAKEAHDSVIQELRNQVNSLRIAAARPYTCFYVEGRGYFWYAKMPFGLTGAPSTFAHMTAEHLHDLIADGTMELFVDDGASPGDEFDEALTKLQRILQRVRERKLSLSAAKSQFYMTSVTYAGATVGPGGVTPDTAKLTAIVDWKQPANAAQLASFLGVTGHFRDLIKGYSKMEGPLRDLVKDATPPKGSGKSAYKRVMQAYSLTSKWGPMESSAFLALKAALTSEPVLRRPRWDGTPFIVTTDGCKDGFGAVLTQRHTTVLPSGQSVEKLHPIAFASKRTSQSEEKYKPFLLEFAALKFALDKFCNVIWGFPVEIETDCLALRYVLTNDKLNDTHARWRDSVLAYQIIDVRHILGKTNVVADGISRGGEGSHHEWGDGSDWTVCEDWETREGLVNDLLAIENSMTAEIDALLQQFHGEPLFQEVINALEDIDTAGLDERAKRRAEHRASQYMIEGGRLWRVHGGSKGRPQARVECVSQKEAKEMAAMEHRTGGHWGRDAIKLALLDRVCSPKLDKSIVAAISECGQCKNFGGTHLHALLDPITRRRPFELLVGDYLSLPTGKGGHHTLGVFLNTFSQHVWAFKFKTAGSSKTTNECLDSIFKAYTPFDTFMTDGSRHFNSQEVRSFCLSKGVRTHVVAAYSPWVNGLVEGTNKLLLHILKRLCAPDLGEDDCNPGTDQHLPKNWTAHLDNAVHALNTRILPALNHSPKELLLGIPAVRKPTSVEEASSIPTPTDVGVHIAYVDQLRLDGYDAALRHAAKRKMAFDRRVLNSRAGHITFPHGSLIQVYRSDMDYNHRTTGKVSPKWSMPHRITGCTANSYTLETLHQVPINGSFHSRRLRTFHPRPGTKLAHDEHFRTLVTHETTLTHAPTTHLEPGKDPTISPPVLGLNP